MESPALRRLQDMSWQAKLFVFMGAALLVLGLTGTLSASNGVEIEAEQAVEIGRPELDFEPDNAEARLVRQGFGLRPVWAVLFTIPLPEDVKVGSTGSSDFERQTTVEVDAVTGEVLRTVRD